MTIDNAVLVQISTLLMYAVAAGVILGHVIIGAFRAMMEFLHLGVDYLERRRTSKSSCECDECICNYSGRS